MICVTMQQYCYAISLKGTLWEAYASTDTVNIVCNLPWKLVYYYYM